MATWGTLQTQTRSFNQDIDGKRWEDAEMLAYAVLAQRRVAIDSGWYRSSALIDGVAGVAMVAMPTDYWQLLAEPEWNGYPLTKVDSMVAPRLFGRQWETLVGEPRYYFRDYVGKGFLRLARIPDGTIATVVSGQLNNVTTPVIFGVGSGEGTGLLVDDTIAIYDRTTYPNALDDPAYEIGAITAITGDIITITRATPFVHAGSPTAALAYVDAIGLKYTALPTAPTSSSSVIHLPVDGDMAFIYRVLEECFKKDIDAAYTQERMKYANLYKDEVATLKGTASVEFDILPATIDIPRGFI